MALTLAQLETFVVAARTGNFTRTAEATYLTQSAVTQQMKGLSEHFGVALFDLVGRRVVPTDAGRFLAERAADIVALVDRLERDMHDFAAASLGTLDLGATVTIGNYSLPAHLARFRERVPKSTVRLTVANTAEVCAAVKRGAVSLGLVEGPVDDGDLVARPYAVDELVLVVPSRGHRLSTRRSIPFAALFDEPFVVREEGSGTRAIVEDAFAARGGSVRIAYALSSNEGVARAVEAGLGVTILSRVCVERGIAEGRLREVQIRDAELERNFAIVTHRARTLAPLALAFVEFLTTAPSACRS
jgi:DNA-binding transcriptional LysR family regulator